MGLRYVILSSDIAGEHRFASAVAQRLSQLGALTLGDRHASSAADALSPFNLQTKCAPPLSHACTECQAVSPSSFQMTWT